ncbi:MAG: hypothetical protein NC084_05685 [Bacteroides sp.]|nr:hypothetical protein [Eubacterium sp.]MCM1418045.1 hypothetical protein [Roseburia sp.]MCM1462189.1 hypothetical protein [Bacteroides sp.]
MEMILLAAGCYTVCSLADKYAASTAKLSGIRITFIMAAATAVFMTALLPILGVSFSPFSWQLAIFVGLIAANKLFEFLLGTAILTEMSAFELKAWLGAVLFLSYFTDAFVYGGGFRVSGLIFIAVTAVGLILIARSNRKAVRYQKIALPLVFYIAVKFGYALIMRYAAPYGDSTQILYFALILLAVVLAPKAHILQAAREKKKGVLITAVTKLPNAVGLYAENAALSVSLTGYSMIQPLILVALFLIGCFRGEYGSKLSVAGALIAVGGVIGFQLMK